VKEKLLSQIIKVRRATPHFQGKPVPDKDLRKIVEAGRLAPSGYNLQPWRFIVVQEKEQKNKLQKAVMNQPKVGEASVVIVACGVPDAWKEGDLDEMLELARKNGYGDSKEHEITRKKVEGSLGSKPGEAGGLKPDIGLWVNRHVMIAFTHMMLMAEAMGYDTAPMEGFYEDKVRDVLKIPENVRVVAVLTIGKLKGKDKPYAGRFELSKIIFSESWGKGY
jgi:nitroreductase